MIVSGVTESQRRSQTLSIPVTIERVSKTSNEFVLECGYLQAIFELPAHITFTGPQPYANIVAPRADDAHIDALLLEYRMLIWRPVSPGPTRFATPDIIDETIEFITANGAVVEMGRVFLPWHDAMPRDRGVTFRIDYRSFAQGVADGGSGTLLPVVWFPDEEESDAFAKWRNQQMEGGTRETR